MVRRAWVVVCLSVFLGGLAGCDKGSSSGDSRLPTMSIGDDAPRAYVARAIAACGGEQAIARLQIGRVEMVGRGAFAPGINGQFTIVDTFHLPHRLRREASFSDGKIALKMITVIDGDRGWTKAFSDTPGSGEVRELPPSGEKNTAFPYSVLGNLLELRDPAVTLTRVPSDQEGLTWLSVARGGQQFGVDVFEDRTGHLLGTIKQLNDPTGETVTIRTVYADYRNVSGIDVPMQMTGFRGNDPIMELKIVKLDILPVVDEKLFSRPE
jgi:hypothetical protein